MIELKIKAVSPLMGTKFPLPAYATAGAAAMDLCACMEEPVTLAPGGRQGIPTGIAIALPGPEYVALVCSRSGMGTGQTEKTRPLSCRRLRKRRILLARL